MLLILRFLKKVNPNGRIPVLETEDGRCLPESNPPFPRC